MAQADGLDLPLEIASNGIARSTTPIPSGVRYRRKTRRSASTWTGLKADLEPTGHSIFLIFDPIRIRREHFVQLSHDWEKWV